MKISRFEIHQISFKQLSKNYFMRKLLALSIIVLATIFLLTECNEAKTETLVAVKNFNGFESRAKWGEHLVTVSGCHDCHSPKKMTAMGSEIDSSLLFAGHIAGSPEPAVDKKEMQGKGLVVTTGDLTTWVGPWGTSYTANLTSDATGIGSWKEEQFILALREGKFKGLAGERNLLPPMPWQMYRNFTDNEIKAIFAYLKTTNPVKNVVPPPLPPADK
jgi:hypothetical protein